MCVLSIRTEISSDECYKKKKQKEKELDELREILGRDKFSCLFNSREVLLMKLVPFNHRKDKDYERTTVT